MSLQKLDINPKYISILKSVGIFTVDKVLVYSNLELQKKTNLTESKIKEVLHAAANYVVTQRVKQASVLDVYTKSSSAIDFQVDKLKTGCDDIDSILSGGLLIPGVTEVSGESSSGKTQFCLQTCILTSRTYNDCKCLYICTEDAFPNKRLIQMTTSHSMSKTESQSITDRIFVEHVEDLETLISFLETRITNLLSNHKLKLIIIDSITALFRVEFENWELAARAKTLATVGKLLHKLSHQYKICVICVNQVSAVFEPESSLSKREEKFVPALGLTWSYFVTTRLILARTKHSLSTIGNNANNEMLAEDSNIRTCRIAFSPHLPNRKCFFIVLKQGLKGFNFEDKQNENYELLESC